MKKLTLTVAAVLTLSWVGAELQARTWYVNVAGTGDAPTIHAALDSAIAGDSVLVGPGTYTVDTTTVVPASVVLVSETGPTSTVLEGPYSLLMDGVSVGNGAELVGFWLKLHTNKGIVPVLGSLVKGNIIEADGYSMFARDLTTVTNNLFVSGILDIQGVALFTWNIVMSPVLCPGGLGGAFCNDFVGTLSGCEEVFQGPANFSLDPQFCAPDAGDYRLMASSPCAPGNDPGGVGCGLIGPLGVGCSPVPTKEMSWGGVKALYSEGTKKE